MLYVFHVDVGRMMNFDMTVALSSVENLKDTIERLHGIAASNIVLLVSGGEMLTHSTQVAYYSAGTDTNPIYMFLTGDIKLPPYTALNEPDIDLRAQVERCLELPAVYDTVVTRAQLALKMFELARDEERLSERLVHEQHLQQQGWSAVVANMEDLTDEFRQRYHNFFVAFDRHLEKRAQYLELLRCFGDDLTKLARIPILPGLMPLAEQDFHGFDELLETDDVFSRSQTQQQSVIVNTKKQQCDDEHDDDANTTNNTTDISDNSNEDKNATSPNKKLKMGNEDEPIRSTGSASSKPSTGYNLLQWITRENHNTLKVMAEECIQGLGTFDHVVYEKLKHEVQGIIKLAEQSDVKEIKGLSERLCKLEEFKYKIKSMVQDQKELSTAFQQNQNRAMNLRDASILPDLCDSHKPQLLVMLQNQQKIRDLKRCIAKAKDELGNNLHQRLKRIVLIENAMSEFDNRLLFYHRCLKRAERHITIIEQIHKAPNIYVAAVTEVVRRKIFSGEFCQWASQLAEDFDTIHSEEIKRRENFNTNFEGHFLNILFPGMNDMPPTFANEIPIVFDARLPNITKSDIDILTTHLPDLASQIQLPDMGPVIHFFVSRSGEHQQSKQQTGITTVPQRLSGALLKQVATSDCSLGTDTETDFEKLSAINAAAALTVSVATSTTDEQQLETVARSTLTEHTLMQSAGTLTDGNDMSMMTDVVQAKAELERQRALLQQLSQIALSCMKAEREQLQKFKADAVSLRDDMQTELQQLNDQFKLLQMRSAAEKVHYEQQCEAHAQQLEVLQSQLDKQNNELSALHQQQPETLKLHENYANLQMEMDEMREQLKLAQLEKQQAVQETREALTQEHKTELESLRCRFKLMTNMERTASECSLEKLEARPASAFGAENALELVVSQQEAALMEIRAAFEVEKQREICAAIETERNLWLSKQFPLNSESILVNVSMLKQMLDDKERQLDLMREQDLMLTKENYQLKTRLDALTNEDGNSWLKEKIEYLNRDKNRLEEELNMEKSRRLEMETSVAALKGSIYEPSSTSATRASVAARSSTTSQRTVVLEACDKGDVVFVVWSMRHAQFMAVQDSQTLYFVHADSLPALNLRLPTTEAGGDAAAVSVDDMPIPMPYFTVGRVLGKEYCQAKKSENRYRVPRGTKFYRIKLAPYTSKLTAHRERLE